MRRSTSRRNGNRADEPKGVIRAVGYVRCSDEGQSVSDFNTLDNQKNLISQFVALKAGSEAVPWELTRFYVDDGFSGKNTDRPELTELLNDVKMGKVDVIVVYKLDRITRSMKDFFVLDASFSEQGTALVSIKEQLDTSTPMGRLLRNILLVFAEAERDTIAERTRDKMHAEVRQGRWTGGVVPIGYRVEAKRLVPDPDESPVIPLIYEKYVETRSPSRVRDFLNASGHRTAVRAWKGGTRGGGAWSVQLVDQILRNLVYKGTRIFGAVEVPDSHPALVPPDLFDLVQELLPERRRKTEAKVDHSYLLQGIIHCPHCGVRMTPWYVHHNGDHRRSRDYTAYYECQRGHKNPLQKSCPVKRINAHRLEEALLKDLSKLDCDPAALEGILALLEQAGGDEAALQRLQTVRSALRETETRIERLVAALETGASVASVEKRLQELERQAREYRAEAMLLDAELRQAQREVPTVEAARAWFREAHRTLEDGTDDERREFISHIVKRVEMTAKSEVQVEYYIPPALTADEALGLKLHQAWLPGVDSNHEPSG